jgi:DegV family protein with EDD domain
MKKIKIISDSTLDIEQSIIDKLEIEIIPLSISMNGEIYLDREEIKADQFIYQMKQYEELPKTSQPAIGKFIEVYEKWISRGYEIISIHMANALSGTYSAADSAAKMVQGNVTVFDSMFISKALGFQVVEAAEMALKEANKADILKRLQQIREQSYLYIAVDTLDHLVKGGRIGKGRAFVGSLLNIKPIAQLQNGEYSPITKLRSQSQVAKFLTKQFFKDISEKNVRKVGIAHADAFELALQIKNIITEKIPELEIDISFTTPVVSTHTGPGAIGFMYYTD